MKALKIMLLILLPAFAMAQTPCKVLLADLDSIYVGKCKNGLAHGAGEAWGKFYYKGRFVAGYPEGQGRAEFPDGSVYDGIWKRGKRHGTGKLTVVADGKPVERTYVWEADSIKSEIVPPPYKIITQRNLSRMRVFRQGEGNSVWFFPNSTGGVATDLVDVQLIGDSGKELNLNPKLGYEEVRFPFRGSIRYKAWNKLRTAQTEIFVEIEVSQPGNWVVEIQN